MLCGKMAVKLKNNRKEITIWTKIKYGSLPIMPSESDGHWSISYDNLYYHFGAEISDTNENVRLLKEELRQREEINELIMTEDCIEMTCHLQYCHNCQTDPVSLLSVLGCNIYDEHGHEPAYDSSDEDQTQALSM